MPLRYIESFTKQEGTRRSNVGDGENRVCSKSDWYNFSSIFNTGL